MKNYIKIGKLYTTNRSNTVRLNSDIEMCLDDELVNRTFFYELENEWAPYIVTEVSDAYVIAFVGLALERGADIYFETPISEDVLYNLRTYLIPTLIFNIKDFFEVNLIGPSTNINIKSKNAVGTGFSGGVDSFYSVLSHKNLDLKSKEVTHVLMAVNGAALTGINEELDKEWYDAELEKFKPITEEIGVKLIGFFSNISQINDYKHYWPGGDFIVTSSFVYTLRKLFGTYYWASAYRANQFKFDKYDGGYTELFTVPLGSVNGLMFVLDGAQVSRIEKVEYIADNKSVQKSLTVCGEIVNCGGCSKCLRTMSELFAVGKLEEFSEVFPVERYVRHFSTLFAREIGVDHKEYVDEIKDKMKEKGKKIPTSAYIKGYLIYKPFNYLRPRLKNNKFADFVYYKLGLYKVLGGREKDEKMWELVRQGKSGKIKW